MSAGNLLEIWFVGIVDAL